MAYLLEEEKLFIYSDTRTGKNYLFDGTKLVEIPDNDMSNVPYHLEMEDDDSSNDNQDNTSEETNDSSSGSGNSSSEEASDDEASDAQEGDSDNNGLGGDPGNSSDDAENTESNTSSESDTDNQSSESSDGDSNSNDDSSSDAGQEGDSSDDSQQSSDNDSQSSSSQSGTPSDDSSDSRDEGGIEDIDWDNIDWDALKKMLEDVLDNIDDLSPEEKQKFYDELRKHLDEVDEEVLEKEAEERAKQIEEETSDYDPSAEDAEARLKEIANDIESESVVNDLLDEVDTHVYQDRAKRNAAKKKAEQEAKKYNTDGTPKDFVLDINKLIQKEVKKINSKSWGKINKKVEGSGIMKPGKVQKKNPEIPRLFVYFDQSSSWTARDIEVGIKAIETLNSFVKKKQLIIEVYYFANDIYDTSPGGGGTRAGRKLIEHIRTNKPDNVLIMTDADFENYIGGNPEHDISQAPFTQIPGGVFLLFKQGLVSKHLVDKLRGKMFTKIYSF